MTQCLRWRRRKHIGKNEITETYINTIMFILQHHLQHLIIGFGMSKRSSFSHRTLAKQLPYKRNSEDEAKSFKDKCTFLSPFHFLSDDFDMDSHDFDFNTLRNKANVKGSLHKNLKHWHHIEKNPSDIDSLQND